MGVAITWEPSPEGIFTSERPSPQPIDHRAYGEIGEALVQLDLALGNDAAVESLFQLSPPSASVGGLAASNELDISLLDLAGHDTWCSDALQSYRARMTVVESEGKFGMLADGVTSGLNGTVRVRIEWRAPKQPEFRGQGEHQPFLSIHPLIVHNKPAIYGGLNSLVPDRC